MSKYNNYNNNNYNNIKYHKIITSDNSTNLLSRNDLINEFKKSYVEGRKYMIFIDEIYINKNVYFIYNNNIISYYYDIQNDIYPFKFKILDQLSYNDLFYIYNYYLYNNYK